jgi:hypothetical protein
MAEIDTWYGKLDKEDTSKMGVKVQRAFNEVYKAIQDRDAPAVSAKGLSQKQIDNIYAKHDKLCDHADKKIFALEQAIKGEIAKGYSFKTKDYTNARVASTPENTAKSQEAVGSVNDRVKGGMAKFGKEVSKDLTPSFIKASPVAIARNMPSFIKKGIAAIGDKIRGGSKKVQTQTAIKGLPAIRSLRSDKRSKEIGVSVVKGFVRGGKVGAMVELGKEVAKDFSPPREGTKMEQGTQKGSAHPLDKVVDNAVPQAARAKFKGIAQALKPKSPTLSKTPDRERER